jgi:hypothetical protein
MINNTPLRFTTLHLAQRFLIDDETRMITISFLPKTEQFVQKYSDKSFSGLVQPKLQLYRLLTICPGFSWPSQ